MNEVEENFLIIAAREIKNHKKYGKRAPVKKRSLGQ